MGRKPGRWYSLRDSDEKGTGIDVGDTGQVMLLVDKWPDGCPCLGQSDQISPTDGRQHLVGDPPFEGTGVRFTGPQDQGIEAGFVDGDRHRLS